MIDFEGLANEEAANKKEDRYAWKHFQYPVNGVWNAIGHTQMRNTVMHGYLGRRN